MADNLIFPIGFDLEKAVKEAGQQWDKTYAKKLEDYLAKRPVRVKLGFDTKKLDNLDEVKRRLAELKIEPLTPANKTAIQDLVRELKALARIMEKVQKFKGIELPELQQAKAAKLRKDVAQADEKLRLSQERVRQAQERLTLAQQRAEQQARRTSNAYASQGAYLQKLVQRMAAYWSVRQVGNFLTSVREVTAEFELQRVSLGAILQDQAKANQLFAEIKSFALKSPVKILDLTKYTKQLAAYKVGYDELFETTKKLTDVSVGLGVAMDRVVLAYGQTRATGYLRASEIRQFTEMGVPIVEELAAKLSKMNGELVTAAQVMDMVSKRGISFEMVKEVFDDMTSAGGIFYNMQEKQGNTLYGMWAKLGDAASVMYEQIGNTDSVNSAMKGTIQLLTDLMRNWEAVGKTILWVGLPTAIAGLAQKRGKNVFDTKAAKTTENRRLAQERLNAATAVGSARDKAAAQAALSKAMADEKAAAAEITRYNSMSKLGKMIQQLKAGFVSLAKSFLTGLGIGAVIGLITTAAYKLFEALTNADRLKNKLDEIETETAQLTAQSTRNFKRLADAALDAVDGSTQQKEALDELHRTYRDIIDVESLSIDNLRSMREEGYEPLIKAVEEYIAVQQKQKALSAANEEFNADLIKYQKNLKDNFIDLGYSAEEWGIFFNTLNDKIGSVELPKTAKELNALANEYRESSEAFSKLWEGTGADVEWNLDFYNEKLLVAISLAEQGIDDVKLLNDIMNDKGFLRQDSWIKKFIDSTNAYRETIEVINRMFTPKAGETEKFAQAIEHVNDRMKDVSYTMKDNALVDEKSFLYSQMKQNRYIRLIGEEIQNNPDIKKAFDGLEVEIKDEWFDLAENKIPNIAKGIPLLDKAFEKLSENIDSDKLEKMSVIHFDMILEAIGDKNPQLRKLILEWKKEYENIVPSDKTVRAMQDKLKALTEASSVSMDVMQKHLMKSGESWKDYSKRVHDAVKDYEAQIDEMQKINASIKNGEKGIGPLDPSKYSDEEIKKVQLLVEVLKQLIPFLAPEKSSGGGRQSDPRLQNLKEEISLTKKLYDEYHKLEKQIGATKAAEKIQDIYSNTIKTLQERAGKYGFEFELPFTDENLKSNMQHFIDKMKELQGLKDKKGKLLFPNIGKEIDEAVAQLEDVDLNSLQKSLEKKLKQLADRISRTKTAKEFYEKILSQTGDVELAANLSLSIYGENGEDLDKAIRDNIQATLGKNKQGIDLDFSAAIRADGSVDYNALTKIAKGYLDMGEISEETYNKILKMRDEDRKDLAKTVEGWLKATEKARTYSDKLLDLRRKTQTEIDSINEKERRGDITPEFAESQRAGFLRKEAEEVAKLQYEAFKDSPMYVQMFDDLDNASTAMLRNMKQRIEELKTSWKDLTPTQLKEMQSRLNEIDAQLAKRNPFKGLIDGIKKYRNLRKDGDALGNKSEGAAEKALDTAAKARLEAEKEYLEILNKEDATQEEIAKAKERFDKAASNEDAAAKAVENWKKVKDAIGVSANELFQMLNWAGDIAKGIADISEAMGADEEDVQYWNDVADALGQISGGIQDIVSAAMSGNVVGIISSTLTAIPKMFVGFTNLFSAGKVKKANKEIKRQQELLEQLEYTYSRLEAAADKAFGSDYINNFRQQQKNLEAQASAYQKQANAERSKGKKADKDKIKEYEDAYRETMDEIADMQGQIAAQMLGTDLTSAARDFAKAWLDAYKEFSNTADAMSEKFHEMVENMVVESLLAKVMERALKPAFDMIDNMGEQDFYSQSFWKKVVATAEKGAQDADQGAQAVMRFLEKAGISMRDMSTEYTGIKRDIAGASEETMSSVAVIGNTLMYYVSPIPRIDENLAAIRRIMEIGETPSKSAAIDTTALWNRHLELQQGIYEHTRRSAEKCEAMALHCKQIADDIHKVIAPKGSSASSAIQVRM